MICEALSKRFLNAETFRRKNGAQMSFSTKRGQLESLRSIRSPHCSSYSTFFSGKERLGTMARRMLFRECTLLPLFHYILFFIIVINRSSRMYFLEKKFMLCPNARIIVFLRLTYQLAFVCWSTQPSRLLITSLEPLTGHLLSEAYYHFRWTPLVDDEDRHATNFYHTRVQQRMRW